MSFQLFRSADRFRPSKLGENGLALERDFIHATCWVVLWRLSAKSANNPERFEMPFFAKLSTFIGLSPPCGLAAARAMTTLGIRETMQQKLLKWASIAHVYQFAKIAKAELDFITLPRLTHCGIASRRPVPQETFDPLRQHAVLLEAGSTGKRTFVDFLTEWEPHGGIARRGCAWQTWN